ncbi:hypothetical protein Tco_0682031 [Tanacetum coccineum]|uniref:CCHC-type domain-containing protein n=1 Tax=Tanacetum coccineum TaxID=301880 RepID=A0ABQ4XRM4_9ASTR
MTCSNCYQRGHNKKRCKNETVDPPPKEVRPKGKRKGGQNGFESASSALKRMRMDATASGSGLSEILQMFKDSICHVTGSDGTTCATAKTSSRRDVSDLYQEAEFQATICFKKRFKTEKTITEDPFEQMEKTISV